MLTNPHKKGLEYKERKRAMNETRSIVKGALGFLLAILVIVGAVFGIDVKVDVEDQGATEPAFEETATTEQTDGATSEKEKPSTTQQVVETQESPAKSTQARDENVRVDESVMTDVANQTDKPQNVATEGEK